VKAPTNGQEDMNESKQASAMICRNDRERERERERERRERGEGGWRGGFRGGSEDFTKQNLVAILTLCSTSMGPPTSHKRGEEYPNPTL